MTRLAISLLLSLLGLTLSAAAYHMGQPDSPIFYWGILPGAPFLLLAICTFIPRLSIQAIAGAAIGSLIAGGMPYGLLLYSSANYSGGGANIGLGILLIAQPIYVPIAMMLGATVGHLLLPKVQPDES